MSLTQKNRLIAVETPLGADALLLSSFAGHEEMSRLFSYHLDMLSDQDDIAAKKIVGQRVSFRVLWGPEEKERWFNGFVNRFSAGSRETGLRRYQAEVVPWLWFLTRRAGCRIFQDKTIPEIIGFLFKELGFKEKQDFDLSQIKGSHPKWEYCVQYRETDFNFVSRLMEQEGIFYFFKHEQDKHTMMLADQKGAYYDCPQKDVETEFTQIGHVITESINSWQHQYEFTSGRWAQTDYNFIDKPARTTKIPSSLLMSKQSTVVKLDGLQPYEIYDYPGEFSVKADGDADTKIRMEEEEVTHDTVAGGSTCRTFTLGGKFKVKTHDSEAEVGKGYAITAIQHSCTEPSDYGAGDTSAISRDAYQNTFTCIPDAVTFRPHRLTPKPVIHGSQTAVVTGPAGEEIWPDKYGRVKVQFFWDREGERNDKTSCWIRCSQGSAGKGWGTMFIPRIGQEVVVSYLEGDPDQPLITGVVYNADQMPAYELPAEKTKSWIKTNSTKGGEGFNEVRFEDKKDKEQIFIHAQRNMDVRVLNDSMERIFGNRHQIIGWEKDGKKGGDQRELVYQDKHQTIKRHQVEHIEGNMQLLIGKGEADEGGNLDVVLEKNKRELIEQDCDIHVKGQRNEKVDGTQSLTVGSDQQEKVGKNHALEAGMEIHLKAGMKVIIEAGMQLTLKGPGGFVDIGPAGVTIQGTMVLINSGGSAGSGTGAKPTAARDAKEAKAAKPDLADNSKTGQKSAPDSLS